MKSLRLLIRASVVVLLWGCSDHEGTDARNASPDRATSAGRMDARAAADSRNAAAALEEMLVLAKAGDWSTYVDRYYGEAQKFRTDADRRHLVQRFENRWGDAVIDALERAVHEVPVIEGNQAIFRIDGEDTFILYRSADGSWRFHL